MSAVLPHPMSRDEFLAWEERQELRHEFDGRHVRAMTGGTAAHAAIQRNLLCALAGGLRGKRFTPFGNLLKVLAGGSVRYPDAFVICTPVPPRVTVVTDPVVVFEIVSPSSVSVDFVTKNAEYCTIPSVHRYVVLQQATAAAAVFFRDGENWLSELTAGDGAVLHMPEIDVAVSLAEIYRDLDLSPASGIY